MRALLTGLATALILASPAAAAVTCEGSAEGARGDRVSVSLRVEADGRVTRGGLDWGPPSPSTETFPLVIMSFDLEGDRVGPLRSIGVGAIANTENGPPRSRRATIEARLDDRTWRRPWTMFEGHMAMLRAGETDPQGKSVAFWGLVPMAWAGPGEREPTNPDLLRAAEGGGAMEVVVAGDRDEIFGRRTFDLSDTAARDALMREALAKARAATADLSKCKAD